MRIGKFEFANQGTILLDEIGEMPASLQAKLLHVLQDREFTRLGSNRPVSVDVRVIAATNRDLEQMIRAGTFREDLYYRLQVIEIRVPALRDRRDEIVPLAEFFLIKYAARYGRSALRPSTKLREAFLAYPWPGNVRELENVIKRFVILQDEELVLAELQRPRTFEPALHGDAGAHEPTAHAEREPRYAMNGERPVTAGAPAEEAASTAGVTLPELARRASIAVERQAIQQTLDQFRWNRRKAARALGVSYKTLLNKMKECGITAPAD
jgi:two-component system response regulator AtoC